MQKACPPANRRNNSIKSQLFLVWDNCHGYDGRDTRFPLLFRELRILSSWQDDLWFDTYSFSDDMCLRISLAAFPRNDFHSCVLMLSNNYLRGNLHALMMMPAVEAKRSERSPECVPQKYAGDKFWGDIVVSVSCCILISHLLLSTPLGKRIEAFESYFCYKAFTVTRGR